MRGVAACDRQSRRERSGRCRPELDLDAELFRGARLKLPLPAVTANGAVSAPTLPISGPCPTFRSVRVARATRPVRAVEKLTREGEIESLPAVVTVAAASLE